MELYVPSDRLSVKPNEKHLTLFLVVLKKVLQETKTVIMIFSGR